MKLIRPNKYIVTGAEKILNPRRDMLIVIEFHIFISI